MDWSAEKSDLPTGAQGRTWAFVHLTSRALSYLECRHSFSPNLCGHRSVKVGPQSQRSLSASVKLFMLQLLIS